MSDVDFIEERVFKKVVVDIISALRNDDGVDDPPI